ncbi:MAG: phospholipid carrier-dependent glycosyltransferase [Pleurocapsa minor GSE-CHR-MK-17-07R]|jgi:hypothetical protein|nr:phospholipid carrier-dependent glycosyltransferase [Pleurocapsa minor GSE-CHR-MK 17-07R]
MTITETIHQTPKRPLWLALFCLTLAVCLFVYTGEPNSADGDAMLAAAASLLRTGDPTIGQVLYADMLFPIDQARMGTFDPEGALYSKKGITPTLFLLPLTALAELIPPLGTTTAAMLLNALITAATSVMLFVLCRELGFSARVSFVTGLLYVCTTIALHYSRTLFGEPSAALLMVTSVWGVITYSRSGRWPLLLITGAALGALVGVNSVYAVTTGLLTLLGLTLCWRKRSLRDAVALLLPLGVWAIGLLLYNAVRFGDPLTTGYRFTDGEGFTEPFFTGLAGLLISPYRGLLWYSPIVLLALPGGIMLWRGTRWTGLFIFLIALQAVLFASWWSWSGGVVWGTRFMLPALPLAMLLVAPVIAWAGRSRAVLAAVIFFALVSGVISVAGALADEYSFIAYETRFAYGGDILNSTRYGIDTILFDANFSAAGGALAQLLAGEMPVSAWAQVSPVLIVPPLLLAALAIALLRLSDRRMVAAVGIALVLVTAGQAALARQSPEAQAVAQVETLLDPPGTVAAATDQFGSRLLDVRMRAPVVVVNAPTEPDDRDARPAWEWASRQRDRLWLLTWFGPADPLNWQERDAFERFAYVRETTAANHRAVLFDTRPIDGPSLSGGYRFGSITLEALRVSSHGDGLGVALGWRALELTTSPANWFVHVLDASGQIIAQQDRQPLGGYSPAESWDLDARVTDRAFFPVDPALADSLRIGWVFSATGERLPVRDPQDTPVTDGFIVVPLRG